MIDTVAAIVGAVAIVAGLGYWAWERHKPVEINIVADPSDPVATALSVLVEEAIRDGRVIVGEPFYVRTIRHPSGIDIPVQVWGQDDAADTLADEALDYLVRRQGPR